MKTTGTETACGRGREEESEAYKAAKRKLARVRSFVERLSPDKLRRATRPDLPENVGHHPEETH